MRRLGLGALLLAALAAGACREGKRPPPTATSALADSADQVMFGARSLLTDRGLLRAELLADTAYFFDESSRIEMRNVRTTFYTTAGAKNAVLTSEAGTYNRRAEEMAARGNVVIQSEDGRRLVSPEVRYNQRRNEVSSDSAFTLTEPGKTLRGIGFVSDPDMNNVRCLRACGGTAGTFTLPGQR